MFICWAKALIFLRGAFSLYFIYYFIYFAKASLKTQNQLNYFHFLLTSLALTHDKSPWK